MLSIECVISMLCYIIITITLSLVNCDITLKEKHHYRDVVVEMFFHAYDNYLDHAYPADELMPLSCKGRVRGHQPNRGDIDECLGSFSLTLIDSLDTLAVIGAIDEFSEAIKLVLRDVQFNADLTVSVFETNIRVLGGLLGAHFAAEYLRDSGHPLLQWYKDELVEMATHIGDKLLPAFNTTTGIPYSRINLRHGINNTRGRITGDTTCTACAGTMLMEFAALSRLTGNPDYELKAHLAMEALWDSRHHINNLVGTVINVHNGQWTRKDSGVGAGIDSYYEYCLKSYILLGDTEYLKRFSTHYTAIKQYIISNGPNLYEVNMNSPVKPIKRSMDSLLAFWPGLQVLWGDIDSAVDIHNMLYHVTVHNRFIPESFSTEFKPIWPQYPLRPEFIESTYFLYQATNDPYYLDIGKTVIDNLNKYTRVPCGFATIKDVRGSTHEDRMDSFVLAETFKYLYLLFAEEDDLVLEMDDFIFTTEAHILPLKLSKYNNNSSSSSNDTELPSQCLNMEIPWTEVDSYEKLLKKQCSVSRYTYELNGESIRKVKQMLRNKHNKMSLRVLDFGNAEHLAELKNMGISFEFQDGGKVLLAHNPNTAISEEAAQDGKDFMEEVIHIMKRVGNATDIKREMKRLVITEPLIEQKTFIAGPAMFGPQLGGETRYQISGELVVPKSPVDGCSPFDDVEIIRGKIFLILRGGCMFVDKVRFAEKSGAIAAIIYDNLKDTTNSEANKPIFPFSMSGDGLEDVNIPSVLISRQDGLSLLSLIETTGYVQVLLTSDDQNIPEETSLKKEDVETNSKDISRECSEKLCKNDDNEQSVVTPP